MRIAPDLDSAAALRELQRSPIVRVLPEGRMALHHQVRHFAREIVKKRAPELFADINELCRRFHEQQTVRPDLTEDGRRRSALELIFHAYESSEDEGIDQLSTAVNAALQAADADWASNLVAEASSRFSSTEGAVWLDAWQGQIAYRRGEWDGATEALTRVINSQLTDHPAYAAALITLGRMSYQRRGDLVRAATEYEAALELLEPTGEFQTLAYAMEQLAKVYRMRGELSRATQMHEEGLGLAERHAGGYALASGFGSYGTTLMLSGDLARGTAELDKSIEESRKAGFQEFVCTGLRSRAIGLALQGRVAEAEAESSESFALAEALGDRFNRAVARAALAHARLAGRHDLAMAALDITAAVAELRDIEASYDLANALTYEGAIRLVQEGATAAAAPLREAEALFDTADFAYGSAVSKVEISRTPLASGDAEGAYTVAVEGRSIADGVGARFVAESASVQALVAAMAAGVSDGLVRLRKDFELEPASWAERLAGTGYHGLAAVVRRASVLAALEASGNRAAVARNATAALSEAARHNAVAFLQEAQALHHPLAEIGMLKAVIDTWAEVAGPGDPRALYRLAVERTPWVATVDLRELWADPN